MSVDDRAPSYLDTHPVADRLECRTCNVTIAAEELTDLVRALFLSFHQGDGHDVTDSREPEMGEGSS